MTAILLIAVVSTMEKAEYRHLFYVAKGHRRLDLGIDCVMEV
jgi:hypothetical protein